MDIDSREHQMQKELSEGERFQKSEERFERELAALVKRRLSIEEKFKRLKEQPATNLGHLVAFPTNKKATGGKVSKN